MTANERKILGIEDEQDLRDMRTMLFSMTTHMGRITGQFEEMERQRADARKEDRAWKAEIRTTLDAVPNTIAAAIEKCREARIAATQPTVTAVTDAKLVTVGVAKAAGVITLLSGAIYGVVKLVGLI
jgi:hypothetical protein